MISAIVALIVTRPFANMTMALLKSQQKKPREVTEDLNGKAFSQINFKDITHLNVIYYDTKKIVYRL